VNRYEGSNCDSNPTSVTYSTDTCYPDICGNFQISCSQDNNLFCITTNNEGSGCTSCTPMIQTGTCSVHTTYALEYNCECFPGSSSVRMADGSEKEIRDIQIGDEVLTADDHGNFRTENVLRLAHPRNYAIGTYRNVIIANEQGERGRLKITPNHLVYRCHPTLPWIRDEFPIQANLLKLGDFVCAVHNGTLQPLRVIELSLSTEVGAYSAFTPSGSLIVDTVLCSGFTYTPQTW